MVYKLNEDMLDPLVDSHKSNFFLQFLFKFLQRQFIETGILADRGVGECGSIEVICIFVYLCICIY